MLPRIAFSLLVSLSDAGPITSDIELKVSIGPVTGRNFRIFWP